MDDELGERGAFYVGPENGREPDPLRVNVYQAFLKHYDGDHRKTREVYEVFEPVLLAWALTLPTAAPIPAEA
jgi:hypothetical protein